MDKEEQDLFELFEEHDLTGNLDAYQETMDDILDDLEEDRLFDDE
jgi:hypothetical protein